MVVRALCDGLIRASLLAIIALAVACSGDDDDDGAPAAGPADGGGGKGSDSSDGAANPAADAGTSRDGGPQDAGSAGTLDCRLKLASDKIAAIVDPEVQFPLPSFAWTGDGVVGVWPRFNSAGYRVVELDRDGETKVPFRSLWPDEPAMGDPSIAVKDGVLAIADRRQVGTTMRSTCRLALVELNGGPSLLTPRRVSDVPDDETGQDEAGACQVAAIRDGFLVVWQQHVSMDIAGWKVFAQRFDEAGAAQGARLTLGVSSEKDPISPIVGSSGQRVLVVQPRRAEPAATLSYVEGDEVETVEVALGPSLMLIDYGHSSFMVRTVDHLHFLDGHGQPARDPVDVGLRARFAPLGMGYVSLSQEEFVVARAYDAALRKSSLPVSLSSNRAAVAEGLVYAPDGESAAAIVIDFSALLYVPFTCEQK